MAEVRGSQLALLAELEAQVVRVSQLALLVELDRVQLRVSQLALLVELDQVQIRVSQLALLVELEYEPPHQAGGPASSAGTAAGATTTPAAAPAAGKAATAPAAATVSAAAAAYGNQLFMALAASKAAVAPTTVLSLGGSGGAGGMSEVRSVAATVSVDWDRNGSFTDESNHLVSVRGSQNLAAPEALLAGGRGAVAGCSIVLSNHDFRYSIMPTAFAALNKSENALAASDINNPPGPLINLVLSNFPLSPISLPHLLKYSPEAVPFNHVAILFFTCYYCIFSMCWF